ncbi:MAG: DUF6261 family protein [Bacteroidales bacterium]
MTSISKINLKSTNGEIDATTHAINIVLKKDDWLSDTYFAAIIESLQSLQVSLNRAIKQSKAESDLKGKDLTRDRALSELFSLVRGYTTVDSEIGIFAKRIELVLNKYGLSKTTNSNYANESAYINSLIIDLSEGEVANAVRDCPFVAVAVSKLMDSQKAFEQAYEHYIVAMTKDRTKSSATSIKANLVKVINNELVDYLRVMSKVNAEVYGPTTSKIAGIIKDNNERVKNRKG